MNFLIHILSALLQVAVLRRLGLGLPVACLAGGLFALGFGHYGKEVMCD